MSTTILSLCRANASDLAVREAEISYADLQAKIADGFSGVLRISLHRVEGDQYQELASGHYDSALANQEDADLDGVVQCIYQDAGIRA